MPKEENQRDAILYGDWYEQKQSSLLRRPKLLETEDSKVNCVLLGPYMTYRSLRVSLWIIFYEFSSKKSKFALKSFQTPAHNGPSSRPLYSRFPPPLPPIPHPLPLIPHPLSPYPRTPCPPPPLGKKNTSGHHYKGLFRRHYFVSPTKSYMILSCMISLFRRHYNVMCDFFQHGGESGWAPWAISSCSTSFHCYS